MTMKRTNIDRYYGDFLQHTHSEVEENIQSTLALSANQVINENDISYLSGVTDNVYSTVESNSATWSLTANYDSEIASLSSNIDNNSDNISIVSGDLIDNNNLTNDVYSTVESNSGSWGGGTSGCGCTTEINYLSGQIDNNTDDITNNTDDINDVTSTVSANSGTWSLTANYDSEIASLSSSIDNNTDDINDVTSIVSANSGTWALTANYDNEINYLSGEIDQNSSDIDYLSASISGGGSSLWSLSGDTLFPETSSNNLMLPYLSGTNNSIPVTDEDGKFKDSELTFNEGVSGGSILNMIPFATEPSSGDLISNDIYLTQVTSGIVELTFFNGTDKFKVELTKE